MCVRCQDGQARSCTDTASCSALPPASAGYAVATLTNSFAGSAASPPMFSSCAATTLSFYVDATCQVTIAPLGDATATPNGLQCSTPGNDNYTVPAYYTSDTTIMTLLSDT